VMLMFDATAHHISSTWEPLCSRSKDRARQAQAGHRRQVRPPAVPPVGLEPTLCGFYLSPYWRVRGWALVFNRLLLTRLSYRGFRPCSSAAIRWC